jgi:type II secretory pathway pseudopilin PulG
MTRGYRMLKNSAGFSLIETVVALGLASLLLAGILTMVSASWRTEHNALADSRLQHEARSVLSIVTNGDPGTTPAVQGLIRARQVVLGSSSLAYRVTWSETVGGGTLTHDDSVSYYLSGTALCRLVADYVAPLTIVTTGGTPVAAMVTTFTVATVTGTSAVSMSVTASDGHGGTMTMITTCKPRNIGP